jgi:hypothetical protein
VHKEIVDETDILLWTYSHLRLTAMDNERSADEVFDLTDNSDWILRRIDSYIYENKTVKTPLEATKEKTDFESKVLELKDEKPVLMGIDALQSSKEELDQFLSNVMLIYLKKLVTKYYMERLECRRLKIPPTEETAKMLKQGAICACNLRRAIAIIIRDGRNADDYLQKVINYLKT